MTFLGEAYNRRVGSWSMLLSRSVQTLHDWGNTSSSSIWYETDWIERFGVSWQTWGATLI